MYDMSLSNLGGVGVQIVRIYINSTGTAGTGCSYSSSSSPPHPQPCVLNPSSSPASYTFQQSAQFINAGEVNHTVPLYLPSANPNIVLPDIVDQNTIFIVTSRGNVFSFQWPFQIQMGGQSQFAFSAGIVKAAYQTTSSGYDSKNEPGPVAEESGGTATPAYCHKETESTPPYPPGAGNSEEVTDTNYQTDGSGIGDNGVLWFVNPWVTQPILLTTSTDCTSDNGLSCPGTTPPNSTTLYLAVNITNTGVAYYTVAGGSLDLTWFGSNHIDGSLIGIYYEAPTATSPQFYTTSATKPQQIAPGTSFQGIYRVTTLQLTDLPTTPVMFWGSAALTNNLEGAFVGGVSLSSGLWIPYTC
jgi:hypothetical protein